MTIEGSGEIFSGKQNRLDYTLPHENMSVYF